MKNPHYGRNQGPNNPAYGRKGKLNPSYKGINTRCLKCGKEIGYNRKTQKCWKCYIKERVGENHPHWKGGAGLKSYPRRNGKKEIQWREVIFARDGFSCQICKQVGGELQAHHIKSWTKYPRLRYKIVNGVTLCFKCHRRQHGKGWYEKN